MRNQLDYNRDGKISSIERARVFSLAMAAIEDDKQNTLDDYDTFYAEDEDFDEYITVSATPKPKPRPKKTKKQLEKEYQTALRDMHNAKVDLDYSSCATSFFLLGDYKDSKALYEQCNKTYKELRDKELKRMNRQDAVTWIMLIFVIPTIVLILLGFH